MNKEENIDQPLFAPEIPKVQIPLDFLPIEPPKPQPPPIPPQPKIFEDKSNLIPKVSYKAIGDKKITVYIGKINARVNNDFLFKILESCGKVETWRRVKDPVTDVFKTFGFCDYCSAEGALKALRNLNGLDINGDKLLVKVDEKTTNFLNDFKIKKMLLLYSKNTSNIELQIANEEIMSKARAEENERERTEDEKIRQEIIEMFIAERNSETRYETLQTESEVLAVKNTIERQFSEAPKEETAKKKMLITESIRRFRSKEREKEAERIEKEKDRIQRKEREKKEISERESYREKERLRTIEDDEEKLRKKREKEIRYLEQKEKEREEMIKRAEMEEKRYSRYDEEDSRKIKKKRSKYDDRKRKRDYIIISDDEEEKEPVNTFEPFIPQEKVIVQINKEPKEDIKVVEKDEKIQEIFNQQDDEEDKLYSKKHKISLINFDEIKNEQKIQEMLDPKNIISSIPTDIKELFSYPIQWDFVDKYKIIDDLKDFISKKIKEIFSEEDPITIDFIYKKMLLHTTPQDLVNDLEFLEKEAEVFTAKLWRMLIFKMKRKELEIQFLKNEKK